MSLKERTEAENGDRGTVNWERELKVWEHNREWGDGFTDWARD